MNTSEAFQTALEILYGVAFKTKFLVKKENPDNDFVVMPLEGLWYCDDMSSFSMDKKNEWKWTLMILQPDFVTKKHFEAAEKEISDKKGLDTSAVRLEMLQEGMSLQTLHIGTLC